MEANQTLSFRYFDLPLEIRYEVLQTIRNSSDKIYSTRTLFNLKTALSNPLTSVPLYRLRNYQTCITEIERLFNTFLDWKHIQAFILSKEKNDSMFIHFSPSETFLKKPYLIKTEELIRHPKFHSFYLELIDQLQGKSIVTQRNLLQRKWGDLLEKKELIRVTKSTSRKRYSNDSFLLERNFSEEAYYKIKIILCDITLSNLLEKEAFIKIILSKLDCALLVFNHPHLYQRILQTPKEADNILPYLAKQYTQIALFLLKHEDFHAYISKSKLLEIIRIYHPSLWDTLSIDSGIYHDASQPLLISQYPTD